MAKQLLKPLGDLLASETFKPLKFRSFSVLLMGLLCTSFSTDNYLNDPFFRQSSDKPVNENIAFTYAIASDANYGAIRLITIKGDEDTLLESTLSSCVATFTNQGNEVGLLWQYFGNNQWNNTPITIAPGATITQNVGDGQVWEIWNQADDQRFAQFTINCGGET